jgi:hypothetical protein
VKVPLLSSFLVVVDLRVVEDPGALQRNLELEAKINQFYQINF